MQQICGPYITVKLVVVLTLPPLVVTFTLPVVAPVGTVAVICESLTTANVAAVPLNVTAVVCVRPVPLMVTTVPTGPLLGVNVVIVGDTRKLFNVVNVVAPVVAVTVPVNAPVKRGLRFTLIKVTP